MRSWSLLEGSPQQTAQAAQALMQAGPALRVVWMSRRDEPGAITPRQLLRRLGTTADLVVLDLHDELAVDAIAAAHGFLRYGGRMVLRVSPQLPRDPRLAIWPHLPAAVGTRLAQRLVDQLRPGASPLARPQPAPPAAPTVEQDDAVAAALDHIRAGPRRAVLLLAARGRGKSATLGRVARVLRARSRVVLCSVDPAGAQEVHRFAGELPEATPRELVDTDVCWDVVIVDEAARVPVYRLQQLVQRHPDAHLLFATTTAGYEGTGRGFMLRFVDWLKTQAHTTLALYPVEPLRWAPDDPLEAVVSAALLSHATPAAVTPALLSASTRHEVLDQDRLAADGQLCADVFGLLVHAHYRTTPADLHMLLDAPNVVVHALLRGGRAVAVNLLAREGGLSAESSLAISRGQGRLRGHALADTLLTHGGCPEAGELAMLRSVRIATHPDLRRQGLGRQLATAVHAHHQPALFGTLFGATPAILRFRRDQGYRLVRLGGAHGSSSGAPSAVMVRPETDAARVIVDKLQIALARNLPHQLRLLDADGAVAVDPALAGSLLQGLPTPVPPSDAAARAEVQGWLNGPRTSDAVIAALRVLADALPLGQLAGPDRALVQTRIQQLRSWRETAAAGGQPTVRAAQRQLKRAMRQLLGPPSGDPTGTGPDLSRAQ